MQLFQNTLIKSSVVKFYTHSPVLHLKKWLHQEHFVEIFRGEIMSTKKSVMDSYFGSNLQYLQE